MWTAIMGEYLRREAVQEQFRASIELYFRNRIFLYNFLQYIVSVLFFEPLKFSLNHARCQKCKYWSTHARSIRPRAVHSEWIYWEECASPTERRHPRHRGCNTNLNSRNTGRFNQCITGVLIMKRGKMSSRKRLKGDLMLTNMLSASVGRSPSVIEESSIISGGRRSVWGSPWMNGDNINCGTETKKITVASMMSGARLSDMTAMHKLCAMQ